MPRGSGRASARRPAPGHDLVAERDIGLRWRRLRPATDAPQARRRRDSDEVGMAGDGLDARSDRERRRARPGEVRWTVDSTWRSEVRCMAREYRPGAQAISASGSPMRTAMPGVRRDRVRTPSRWAATSFSIFIASTTQTVCPRVTESPGCDRDPDDGALDRAAQGRAIGGDASASVSAVAADGAARSGR